MSRFEEPPSSRSRVSTGAHPWWVVGVVLLLLCIASFLGNTFLFDNSRRSAIIGALTLTVAVGIPVVVLNIRRRRAPRSEAGG